LDCVIISFFTHLSGEEPTLFEKTSLDQLLMKSDYKEMECEMSNQLNLFDKLTGQ